MSHRQHRLKEHLAYLLYTGGTTGPPKGVPGTHAFALQAIQDFWEGLFNRVPKEKLVFVLVNPLFHVLGQILFLACIMFAGNTAVLTPIVQVDYILEAIQKYKANFFMGVPAVHRMILTNDRLDFYDLSSLKYCISGADVLPEEIFNHWMGRYNLPICQAFGSTEAGVVACNPFSSEIKSGSVGFLPSGKDIKLVDPDTLETSPPNTPGEMLVCADHVMKEYWNKPEETKESFVEMNNRRYYR